MDDGASTLRLTSAALGTPRRQVGYHRAVARWLGIVPFVLLACGGSDADPGPGSGGGGGTDALPTTFGGDRPVELFVPSGYDPTVATPLVILLHGHGASGFAQELVFRLEPEAEARTFLYLHPDGTFSEEGKRFWNATDVCCDFFDTGIDDSTYLRSLVDDVSASYNVDPKRVYFTGHSNGGYMSYRMACDHADVIAAIAPLAGAMYADPTDCGASEPVHVLGIHGTEDADVIYDGPAGDPPTRSPTPARRTASPIGPISADATPPPPRSTRSTSTRACPAPRPS